MAGSGARPAGARREVGLGRQHEARRPGSEAAARIVGEGAVRQGIDFRAPSSPLRIQQSLSGRAGRGGIALLRPLSRWVGRIYRASWPSLFRCQSIPSRIYPPPPTRTPPLPPLYPTPPPTSTPLSPLPPPPPSP